MEPWSTDDNQSEKHILVLFLFGGFIWAPSIDPHKNEYYSEWKGRIVWQAILRFSGSFESGFTKQINKRCFAVPSTFRQIKFNKAEQQNVCSCGVVVEQKSAEWCHWFFHWLTEMLLHLWRHSYPALIYLCSVLLIRYNWELLSSTVVFCL